MFADNYDASENSTYDSYTVSQGAEAAKKCGRCCTDLPLASFSVNRARKDGHSLYCKLCASAMAKKRRESDPERARAKKRASYASRMGAQSERKAYNEYHRAYRAAHRDRINEIGAAYHERIKVSKPEILVSKREARRERERAAGSISREQKRAIWEAHDGRCYVCRRDAEQYDHYKPLAAGGLTSPDNLLPICAKCNARKGDEWPLDLDGLRERVMAEYRLEDAEIEHDPARPSEVA